MMEERLCVACSGKVVRLMQVLRLSQLTAVEVRSELLFTEQSGIDNL